MLPAVNQPLRTTDLGLHLCGLGVAATVMYATWIFAIEPIRHQQSGLQQRIHYQQRILNDEVAIRSLHARLELQVAHSQATFERVLARIPETPRESEFLAQITHLARTCRLKIQRYHPREPVNEGTHTALEVQLDASADFEGICTFLDGLRTLDRLCRVTRLRVQAVETEAQQLPIEMTLRIYYAPLEKAVQEEAKHG